MEPAIRTLFVDFGNVCATYDFHRFIENFSRAAKVPAADVETVLYGNAVCGNYSPLFASFECGKIRPHEFFRAFEIALSCTGRVDYSTFAYLWADIWQKENAELDELLKWIPGKKYLLSNTNEIVFGSYFVRCQIVQNHFPLREQHLLSYQIGVIKPDPMIYRVALNWARAEPEQTLFIDDKPENVEAWCALGGIGIVYNAQKDSIVELAGKLRALGLLD